MMCHGHLLNYYDQRARKQVTSQKVMQYTINDHYLGVASFWPSIIGFAVWEVICWQADFSASDIVYVIDVLVTSVLLRCSSVSAMHLEHGSQSTNAFWLCWIMFQGTFLNYNYLRARTQVTSQKVMQYMTTILLLQDFCHLLFSFPFGR